MFVAEIKAFKAVRYQEKAGNIKELTCPPYDIISEEERKVYLSTNSNNVIRLELPKEGEDVYKTAGEYYKKWLSDGVLAKDETEGIYIYEEKFSYDGKDYSLKGLIARVKLEEFSKGVVLPHENTLSKAKEDRFNLMKACHTNFSLVYSLYFDEGKNTLEKAEEKVSKELYNFTSDDGIEHTLWKVEDTDEIVKDFIDRKLYIADGHHRYETALRYKNANISDDSDYVMMMLVPMESDGLVVLPTHRVVHSLENFSGFRMLSWCDKYFDVLGVNKEDMERLLKEIYDAGGIGFGFYFEYKYFVMSLKADVNLEEVFPGVKESLYSLDVTVLHSLILEQILKIDAEALRNQTNLTYEKDLNKAQEMVDLGANCAFILNPTKVEQIAAVAQDGEKMPQKSTYFYPKLITGLVINEL